MNVMAYVWIGLGVIFVLMVFLLLRWVFSLRTVVSPNEVHIVRQGKKTLIYGASASIPEGNEVSGNAYYRWPEWVPAIGVTISRLSLAVFDIDIKGYDAYDKDRLPFVVDVKAFFRICDFKMAAERVESDKELREQLLDICRGAARTILAKEDLESIMGERSKYGKVFTDEVSEQLKAWGVEPVKSIELMDIRDASGEEVIANIMKKKKSVIEKESRVTVAKNMQEAKEAEIASQQEIDLKQAAADQTVGMRKAQVEQEVGVAKQKADQAVQDEKKTTKTKEMDVIQVETVRKAEIDKDKIKIDAEAAQQKTEIDAEAARKKTVINAEAAQKEVELQAEAEKKRIELVSEGNLTQATNNAKGIEAEGEAKAGAEEKMRKAQVAGDIALAEQIGSNEGYQRYLLGIRQLEAGEAVGVEQAKNLDGSNIRIISGAGEGIQGSVSKVMDLFSAQGGLALGTALEAFTGTKAGQDAVSAIVGFLSSLGKGKPQAQAPTPKSEPEAPKPEAPKPEE